MSLSSVVITPEVFLACTTHALTTEAEEIMGLLLGDIREQEGALVAHIRRAVPQIRTDRRRDRVETSPEQMAACSALAEHITHTTGMATRVVGWYHSHPHITVLPSHVDVNTQAMYQMLDSGFVGLIFSVFNASSSSKQQTIQVTAFQSVPGSSSSSSGAGGPWGGLQGCSSGDLVDCDSQTIAAIRASAADLQETAASSWQRKEVPLSIRREGSSNPSTLADYVEVQKMLLTEEQHAHQQRSSNTHIPSSQLHAALLALYDAGVHQQALMQHAECELAPALAAMQQLAVQADIQLQQLQQENEWLKQLLRNQEQRRPGLGCQQLQSEIELGDLITVGTDDAAGDDSASLVPCNDSMQH